MKKPVDKATAIGTLCALVASILFGFSFLAVKLGINEVSALSLLSWRFIFAFIAMTVCAALGLFKIDLKGKDIRPLLSIAIFQPVIYFTAETLGIARTTVAESSAIIACIPLLTLVLSGPMLREWPMRRQWISIAGSVLGVLLIGLQRGLTLSLSVSGYALLCAAMVSDAVFVILSRRAQGYTSAEKTYVMAALGALVFTLAAFSEHLEAGTLRQFALLPFTNTRFLLGCLYLSIGSSVAAFLLFNQGIAALGAARAASFAGLGTPVAVLGGILLFGERLTLLQAIGTALVVLGVYGANILPKGTKEDTHT
ncbi:MAG: DMT family transporter [Christensenellaceae bacterium]|jgi:drug/metabolite transporter (DMT)-like permease|nr:DMT family transporter [Christensenellaceae bacterium]